MKLNGGTDGEGMAGGGGDQNLGPAGGSDVGDNDGDLGDVGGDSG